MQYSDVGKVKIQSKRRFIILFYKLYRIIDDALPLRGPANQQAKLLQAQGAKAVNNGIGLQMQYRFKNQHKVINKAQNTALCAQHLTLLIDTRTVTTNLHYCKGNIHRLAAATACTTAVYRCKRHAKNRALYKWGHGIRIPAFAGGLTKWRKAGYHGRQNCRCVVLALLQQAPMRGFISLWQRGLLHRPGKGGAHVF